MDIIIILLLFLIIFFIYLIYKKNIEHFDIKNYLSVINTQHNEHQDNSADKVEKNNILAQIDSNLIPTYSLYQPEVSGRHLNFFSHVPKEIPYFPNKIWSSTIQDPYYQPAYSNYFYNDGYFYPLY